MCLLREWAPLFMELSTKGVVFARQGLLLMAVLTGN